MRDMVKLFSQDDLEPMAYYSHKTERGRVVGHGLTSQDHQVEIVSPYPELRSCYNLFYIPHKNRELLKEEHEMCKI